MRTGWKARREKRDGGISSRGGCLISSSLSSLRWVMWDRFVLERSSSSSLLFPKKSRANAGAKDRYRPSLESNLSYASGTSSPHSLTSFYITKHVILAEKCVRASLYILFLYLFCPGFTCCLCAFLPSLPVFGLPCPSSMTKTQSWPALFFPTPHSYKDKVKDYNFGSLIRTDARDEYGEKNTIFGMSLILVWIYFGYVERWPAFSFLSSFCSYPDTGAHLYPEFGYPAWWESWSDHALFPLWFPDFSSTRLRSVLSLFPHISWYFTHLTPLTPSPLYPPILNSHPRTGHHLNTNPTDRPQPPGTQRKSPPNRRRRSRQREGKEGEGGCESCKGGGEEEWEWEGVVVSNYK